MSAGLCGIVGECNCLVNELWIMPGIWLPAGEQRIFQRVLLHQQQVESISPPLLVQSPCSTVLFWAAMNKTETRSNLAKLRMSVQESK